jgi:hypothetical protein
MINWTHKHGSLHHFDFSRADIAGFRFVVGCVAEGKFSAFLGGKKLFSFEAEGWEAALAKALKLLAIHFTAMMEPMQEAVKLITKGAA